MPSVRSSLSTKCGTAPTWAIALLVATKVRLGESTSSSAFTPATRSAISIATVPLATAAQEAAPVKSQSICSNFAT